jgi:hypothetical protein
MQTIGIWTVHILKGQKDPQINNLMLHLKLLEKHNKQIQKQAVRAKINEI